MQLFNPGRLMFVLLACVLSGSCLSARVEDTLEPRSGGPRNVTEFRLSFLQGCLDRYIQGTGTPAPNIDVVITGLPENGREELRRDGWGRSLIYTVSGLRYELRSLGEDGALGTHDDLVRPKPQQ